MKKGDILLICAVLILAAAGLVFMNLGGRKSGGTLTVTVGGEVYADYALSEDQEVSLDIDGWHNRFQIKDGKVSMLEADCPDQYCVEHAAIDKVNETIVCLPHKVVLEITEGRSSQGCGCIKISYGVSVRKGELCLKKLQWPGCLQPWR
ncbi:MAG: NusG domain II-containing protein [Frisingicoccus sp.]